MSWIFKVLFIVFACATVGAFNSSSAAEPAQENTVETLEVRAASRGPAWWKISKGDATVWVLGVPPYYSERLVWDKAALRRHLDGARSLLLPPLLPFFPGVSNEERLRRQGYLACDDSRFEVFHPKAVPLSVRKALGCRGNFFADARDFSGMVARDGQKRIDELSNGLVERTLDRARREPGPSYLRYIPQPHWSVESAIFTAGQMLQRRLQLVIEPGDSVVADLVMAAKAAGLTPLALKIDPAVSDAAFSKGPLGPQAECLTSLLDLLDQKDLPVHQDFSAWARGETVSDWPDLRCERSRKPLYDDIAAKTTTLISAYLGQSGKTVAAVELGPLLMPSGVLDRLKAAGYEVEKPY